jgi:hypothetical protein
MSVLEHKENENKSNFLFPNTIDIESKKNLMPVQREWNIFTPSKRADADPRDWTCALFI